MLEKADLNQDTCHLQTFTVAFARNLCCTICDMTGIELKYDLSSYNEDFFHFFNGMIVYINFYGKVQGDFIIGINLEDALKIIGMELSDEQCLVDVREETSGFFKEVLNIASAQTLAELESIFDNLTYFPAIVVFGDIIFPETRSASIKMGSDTVSLTCGFSINLVRPKIARKLENIEKSLENTTKLAGTDALTKLYNRTFFESMFSVYIDDTRSNGQNLSILLIDIDHFKTVNDTYGHLLGDQVIQRIALTIRSHLRSTDIAVRYGGDEILVVLPGTEIGKAIEMAQIISKSVKNSMVFTTVDKREISVNVSISVGCTNLLEGDNPVILFERADNNLYKAKEKGRDRIVSDDDLITA